MWVCGCVCVDIEGCEGFPGAWRPSSQLDLQPLSVYCELVSRTWAITREVTAPPPPPTPPPRPGSSQQGFFQFLLTFFPGSVQFVFLLAMAIDDGGCERYNWAGLPLSVSSPVLWELLFVLTPADALVGTRHHELDIQVADLVTQASPTVETGCWPRRRGTWEYHFCNPYLT